MKPKIDKTKFGSITISGEKFKHDVLIRLDSKPEKRKKNLSKEMYGTSHIISLAEARHIYEEGGSQIIIGAGQDGNVTLSPEAAAFFKRKKCAVELMPTPEAIRYWNKAETPAIGLFHVTC